LRNNVASEANAISLVRQAIDLGINFIDTAQNYGTEPIVGKAIAGIAREPLIISTKKTLPSADHADPENEIIRGCDESLKRLGTDYIDIYHLHGLEPQDYTFARERWIPAMHRLRELGKIRFIGVTEAFVPDPSHTMLRESLREDPWDVVMVGFNMLNPSARKTVFPATRRNRVGTLNMFAVRRTLSQPERFNGLCADLVKKNIIRDELIDSDDPLRSLLAAAQAATLPEAAYRFCRHEPGVDVVLTGTGNPQHLKANVGAILKPALPAAALQRLDAMFSGLDSLTGN
jgi:L-galactose dehydrogenase